MNLPDYIKTKGIPEASALFGLTEAAVKSYRYGWRKPRPEIAMRIVAATGGEVTLAEIFGPVPAPKPEAA